MKKFRGQKRYYNKLLEQSKARLPKLDKELPRLDKWHMHIDENGRGNLGWKHRKTHLKKLISLYWETAKKLKTCEKPFQCWVLVDEYDSCGDSIYIHTPGEGHSYPLKINGSENIDESRAHEDFVRFLKKLDKMKVVRVSKLGNEYFYLFDPTIGENLIS